MTWVPPWVHKPRFLPFLRHPETGASGSPDVVTRPALTVVGGQTEVEAEPPVVWAPDGTPGRSPMTVPDPGTTTVVTRPPGGSLCRS